MQQKPTLSDALELFLLDCRAQRFTKHTLRFYRERLSLFIKWVGESKPLSELASSEIKRFFVHLQDSDLSSAYVHAHARAIRTFCNYCVRDELIEKSPFAKVKMPTLAKKVLPALIKSEISAILNACVTHRDRTLILFLLDSGLRATELCNLNVSDLNLKTGAVDVRQGKQQKDRTAFIGAKVRKAVKLYLVERNGPEQHEPLFVSERGGKRLTYSGLAQIVKRVRIDASVKGFSAHACRRTFAINCLRGGMDIFVLAKLMGHSDITVLRQYLDILRDDLQSAHERHGPIDNMR